MTETQEAAPRRTRARRSDSLYLQRSGPFLERLAAGEAVISICRDPEMPGWSCVQRWLRMEPDFPARFVAAREAGGRVRRGGRPSEHDLALTEAICERVALGDPLVRICAEPGMPCMATVFGWLRRHADFREAYAIAREVQAHTIVDHIAELVEAAEPATVAVTKLKIDALRWQAGRLAPRVFGTAAETKAAATAGRKADPWNDEEPGEPEPRHIVLRTFGPGELTGLTLVNTYEAGGRRHEVYRQVREVRAEPGVGAGL